MSAGAVKKVVIAGGGTAGWIAAAALSRHLGPLLDITLVESDAIGTIGVGEATIPTHQTFHRLLGLDEQHFMRATQATFKLGIAFENWGREGDRYIHAFGQVGKSTWIANFQHIWHEASRRGLAGPLDDYCFELQAAEAERFATSDQATISYAYHLDASLYAKLLREISENNGVKRIEGKIEAVHQHPEDGRIASLSLESGDVVEGDFFIDCTGFRALLIGDALGSAFVDWTAMLPCDRALAVQTEATESARPYTRAVAHDAGWRWKIPLQHRVGNGLVYCSDHLSDDEARQRLLGAVDGATVTDPRLIRFRTGTRDKVWVKNCLALGLSSGFVEPLESTSIHLIQYAVTRLIQLFPFADDTDALSDQYNEESRKDMEHLRDFIVLHYHANQREGEPFWDRCRTMDISHSLSQRIALFQESFHTYQGPDELFRLDSWLQVMMGQRLTWRSGHQLPKMMTDEQLQGALGSLKSNIDKAVAAMPPHHEFIKRYCAAPSPRQA
ncbi:MAG: tryptophan halogenase family protein [Pseudomonadota bacterium]